METLKSWYKYRHKKATKVNPPILPAAPKTTHSLLPSTREPNPVLMDLLKIELPQNEREYLSTVLDKHLPSFLKQQYSDKYLEKFLSQMTKDTPLKEIKEIIVKVPLCIRLKATARALAIFSDDKGEIDDVYKMSWFSNCIKPCLSSTKRVNSSDFG
jgi:hypothetical protein